MTSLRAACGKVGWLFTTHNTSRSAAELLLFLHGGMAASKQVARRATKAGQRV